MKTKYKTWIIVSLVTIVALPFVIWGTSVALAPVFGSGNAYKQTESANYRIANYERFKNDCNAIVAVEGKIILAKKALDSEAVGQVDSFREQQLSTNVQALTNQRLELVTQYNADASKSSTRAKFKDAGLPDYIDPTSKIGVVSCPSS